MKKLLLLMLTAVMINCLPAIAAEPGDQYRCQVQAGTCLKRAESVQKKMKKMQADIKKGKKTYSAEDLQKIEDKLGEVEKMLDDLKAKQP